MIGGRGAAMAPQGAVRATGDSQVGGADRLALVPRTANPSNACFKSLIRGDGVEQEHRPVAVGVNVRAVSNRLPRADGLLCAQVAGIFWRHRSRTGPHQIQAMSRFVVLDLKASGHLITLLDSYGKCHQARLESGGSVALGSELHGPKAAIGLYFLVEAQSGRRLSVVFQVLCVVRPDPPALRHAQASLRRRLALVRSLQPPQAAPRRRSLAPASSASGHQFQHAPTLRPAQIVRKNHPASATEIAADAAVQAPVLRPGS